MEAIRAVSLIIETFLTLSLVGFFSWNCLNMHLHWLKAFSSPSVFLEPSTHSSIQFISASRVQLTGCLAAFSELLSFAVLGLLLLQAKAVKSRILKKNLYIGLVLIGANRIAC